MKAIRCYFFVVVLCVVSVKYKKKICAILLLLLYGEIRIPVCDQQWHARENEQRGRGSGRRDVLYYVAPQICWQRAVAKIRRRKITHII